MCLALASLLQPGAAVAAWLALALLACVMGLDFRASRAAPAPTLQRSFPARARLGESCVVSYELRNAARRALDYELLDELPEVLGGDARIGPQRAAALELQVLEREVTPRRRGSHTLGPSYLYVRSPLGLFVRRLEFAAGPLFHVYPAEAAPPPRGLGSRTLRHELGLRPRRPRGTGGEFESLREYTLDDEPRRIDWRASARARKLIVRNFHVERSHTVLIAVDCGRLMGALVDRQSKLDHALSATISLVQACARSGDRIGFLAFDRELRAFVPPQRSLSALPPILEATLALEPRAYEPSYRALAEVLQQKQKKRALIVVLSDFVEGASSPELEAYLGALARRHCVLLVGVRDRLLREIEQPHPEVSGLELYRRVVLHDLDVARGTAVARITRLGVQTLDLDPAQITAPLLDRYLEIREAGLL
jgi:uncharacterized protein (DUF58 family)